MANTSVSFIEAEGFVPIFDAVDAVVKATNVTVAGVVRLGGGLVSLALSGDLATVEEATEIGEETAKAISGTTARSIVFANPCDAVAALGTRTELLDGN